MLFRSVMDENILKLFTVVREMQEDYTFYFPPVFDGLDDLQRSYNQEIRNAAETSRSEYLEILEEYGEDEAFRVVSQDVFERFIA